MFELSFNENENKINFKLIKGNTIRECNVYVKDMLSNITLYSIVINIEPDINYWVQPFGTEYINLSDDKYGPILIEFYDSLGLNLIYREIVNENKAPKNKYPFITIDKNRHCFGYYSRILIDRIYDKFLDKDIEYKDIVLMGEDSDIFKIYIKENFYALPDNYNEINTDIFNSYAIIDLLYLNIDCEKNKFDIDSLKIKHLEKCDKIIIEFKNNKSEQINSIVNKIANLDFLYDIFSYDIKRMSSVYDNSGVIFAMNKNSTKNLKKMNNISVVFKDYTISEADEILNDLKTKNIQISKYFLLLKNEEPIVQNEIINCQQILTDDINKHIIKELPSFINTDNIIIISKNDPIKLDNLINKYKVITDKLYYNRVSNDTVILSLDLLKLCKKSLENLTEFNDYKYLIEVEYRRLFDLENAKIIINTENNIVEHTEFKNRVITTSGKKIPEHGREGFIHVFNNLINKQKPVLLEIGTQRSYSMGDGCSTTVLGWYCKNYSGHLYSVDIDTDFSERLVYDLNLNKYVTTVQQDAIEFIKTFDKKIDFLYLDAWDWGPEDIDKKISEEKHIEFFNLVESKLSNDALILIDDVINPITYDGKGKKLIPYLLDNGYYLIHRSYQFLFLKNGVEKTNTVKKPTCFYCNSEKSFYYNDNYNKCSNCGLIYYSKDINDSYLYDKYQKMSEPEFHLSTPTNITEALRNKSLRRVDWQNIIKKLNIEKKYIVDIGCAWGRFLYDMTNDHDYKVCGFELTKKNADFALNLIGKNIHNSYFEDFEFDKKPGIISAFHVLEHIKNPMKFLHKVINTLEDGGYFIGSVPNIESFASKKMGEAWPWFESYYHLTHFSINTLNNFFETLGFEVIQIWTKTNFNDFPKDVYKNLLQIFEEKELNNKTQFLEKTFQGEEIRYVVRKPINKIYTKDEVKNILFNHYDSKVDDLPYLPLETYASSIDNVFNPVNGFGDTIIMTQIPKQAELSGKVITISASNENKYFDEFVKYNDYYNPKLINANEVRSLDVSDIAKYNCGAGNVIQRIQKALGIQVQKKPSPYIKYNQLVKIKNSIVFHLQTGNRYWHSNVMKRPVGKIIDKNFNVLKTFINNNNYYYSEVCQNKPELLNFDNVNKICNKSIDELIKEMSKHEYFIGVNSGIMHLAVALGLKCIVISNFPNIDEFYLPKLLYTSKDFELEWCYPQNIHLYQDGENELTKRFNVLNIEKAINGEVYPYWNDDFLDIVFEYDEKHI